MGYTDTVLSKFVPPSKIHKTAGTWTQSVASNVVKDVRTANASAFTAFIPIDLEQGPNYHVGAKIKSIDVYYKILTADPTDFATVEIEKMTLAANTVAITGTTIASAPDADHDTEAKRKAQAEHKMTVTPTAEFWLEKGYAYYLTLVVNAAAGTVFTFYGAQINFELRE